MTDRRSILTPQNHTPLPRTPVANRALAAFCVATLGFLVYRDLAVPGPRETEVWFGFELTDAWARATAPLHWALFAAGAWAFFTRRPWVWRAAACYCAYVALSHVVWNFTSPAGGGAFDAAWQFVLFLAPAPLFWWLDPARRHPV